MGQAHSRLIVAKRKAGNVPAHQPEQAVAPLLGALAREEKKSEESTLLLMVLQQMEAAEQERKLEMAALNAQLKENQELFSQTTAEWQAELAAIKRDNAEAINAVREQFQKLIEAKPIDRATWQQMYKTAMREAQEKIAENHAKFLEDLETMPTGIVHNHEGEPVRLIINGVERVVKADGPTELPQTFVEAWETRQEMKKWAHKLDLSLQSEGGEDNIPQSANKLALTTGRAPIWDQNTGRL